MRLPRALLMLFVLVSMALVAVNAAPAETIIAYYPFETGSPGGTTPDDYSNNDLTLESSKTSIDSAGMFGNALKTTAVTGYAQLDDGDPDFDTNYTNLSVSLWAKTSTWTDEQFGARYLTGKYNTGANHGWDLSVKADRNNPVVHQIRFEGYSAADVKQDVITNFGTALDPEIFHHIVGTFDASGDMCVYVDGILAASETSAIPELRGANDNPFQVSNRGATAGSATSGGGFKGAIDDYLIATGDVLTAQEVALVHGLGRLAGVDMASGDFIGDEIDDVLTAYGEQGSAVAGGQMWAYQADVGGGATVGAIGGSVAGGDAFIVLSADGSGVAIVPEPGSMTLLLLLSAIGAMLVRRGR